MNTEHVRRIVKAHYHAPVTPAQARAEVVSLKRKLDKGTLDDADEMLMIQLELACGLSLTQLAERIAP